MADVFKHVDRDGDYIILEHNKFSDEYFISSYDCVVGMQNSVQVDYDVLCKMCEKFLKYNNYFEE